MSSVIDLRAYVNPSVIQTLVLVDLQQEYIASPRVLALEETKGALANCRAALAHARAMGLPVAFARWIDRTPLFNKATRFSRWIEGFEPHGVDMIFERNRPSCYASADFAEVMGARRRQLRARGFRRRGGVPCDRDRRVPSRPHGHLSGRCVGEPCARRHCREGGPPRRGRRGRTLRRSTDHGGVDRAHVAQDQLARAG